MTKFLYRTVLGRTVLKILTNPKLSVAAGKFLDSGSSSFLAKPFAKKNGIDLNNYIIPEGGFSSFNDFFIRRKKEEIIMSKKSAVSCPSDGLLSVFDIDSDSVFEVKNSRYSMKELLKDKDLAEEFVGGRAFIFRLTPTHYHRYHFAADGKVVQKRRIDGVLHSVRPVCLEETDVFIQNSREYILMELSKDEKLIQMEVGAMLVGRIANYPLSDNAFCSRDDEKGYFEFGGSTIIVLVNRKLKEKTVRFPPNSEEIPVVIGQSL